MPGRRSRCKVGAKRVLPLEKRCLEFVPGGGIDLGREIGDTQPLIHFYADLIGLELLGARTAPRPFTLVRGLQVFAELGEDDDVYKSTSRVALLPIPGTGASARQVSATTSRSH